jgi:hypothetical protein
MDKATNNDPLMSGMGWLFHFVGWAICVASVVFAIENKSPDPQYVFLFWVCFTALVVPAIIYLVAQRFFDRWKTKAIRAYFSPYIVGATIWISLIVLFAALRILG